MTMRALMICLLTACNGGGGGNTTPDAAAPDAAPPDTALPRGCAKFGPLSRHGSVTGPGGPLIASGIASDPHVLRDGNLLKMWFTTSSTTPPHELRIAYAESSDGRAWQNVRDNVLRPTANTFDSQGVETVAVHREPSGYVAYYSGNNPPEGSNQYSIGRATSVDGLVWSKRSTPVYAPTNSWEQPFCIDDECSARYGGTLEPSVIFDGSMYRMWYAGLGALGGLPSYRIGYMTSSDGISWSSHANPVFTASPLGTWDEALVSHVHVVADPAGGYHMFYFGASVADHDRCDQAGGCLFTPGAIGHAFSADGITWTRNPANPILRPEPGFDAWSLGGPSVLIEDGKLHLWYMGTPAAQTLDIRIGYATASCE